jgi:hypothetical protein
MGLVKYTHSQKSLLYLTKKSQNFLIKTQVKEEVMVYLLKKSTIFNKNQKQKQLNFYGIK